MSNAMGSIWMTDETCPVCGKNFICYPKEHVYKRVSSQCIKYFCSWSCLRAYEKDFKNTI